MAQSKLSINFGHINEENSELLNSQNRTKSVLTESHNTQIKANWVQASKKAFLTARKEQGKSKKNLQEAIAIQPVEKEILAYIDTTESSDYGENSPVNNQQQKKLSIPLKKSISIEVFFIQIFFEIVDLSENKAAHNLTYIKRLTRQRQSQFSEDNELIYLSFLNPTSQYVTQDYMKQDESIQNNLQKIEENNKVKHIYNMEDEDGILHVADFKQNKDIEVWTSIGTDENEKRSFKISVDDCATFFRLQHEISEIKRKQENFNEFKKVFFEQQGENYLEQYDKKIKLATIQEGSGKEILDKLKQSKEYKTGIKIAQKLEDASNKLKEERLFKKPNELKNLINHFH